MFNSAGIRTQVSCSEIQFSQPLHATARQGMVYFALGMQLTQNLGFDSRQPEKTFTFWKGPISLPKLIYSRLIASVLTFVSVLALALKTFLYSFYDRSSQLFNPFSPACRFSVFFGSSLHACHGTVNNRLISLKSALLVCPLTQLSGEKN